MTERKDSEARQAKKTPTEHEHWAVLSSTEPIRYRGPGAARQLANEFRQCAAHFLRLAKKYASAKDRYTCGKLALAGLTPAEITGLKHRLSRML